MSEQAVATHHPVWVHRFKSMSAKELSLAWLKEKGQVQLPPEEEDEIEKMLKRAEERHKAKPVLRSHPFPKEIIRRVAAETGVSMEEILSVTRTRRVVAARNKAILAVYEQCRTPAGERLSSARLGKIFRRDHTTILHTLWKAKGK